ncbi:MAG: tetratricopeptide repeat protein [Candidatus Magasanikbacteria bacterium]|nr:tetratricopeptide repeat protein [Candidatus Magasanikbacteria bacterium]
MSFLKKTEQRSSQSLFDTISSLILIVGALVLPLFYLPLTRNVLFFPKSIFFLGVVLLGVLVWLVRVVVTKELYIRRTVVDLPILFFVGVVLISAFASYSHSLSFFGQVDEYVFHVVSVVVSVLWFWLLVQYVNTTILWRWMISLLLLSGLFVGVAFLFRGLSIFQGITATVGVNLISGATSVFGVYIAVLCIISCGLLMVKGRTFIEQCLPALSAIVGFVVLLRIGFTLPWVIFAVGCVGLLVIGMTMLADAWLPMVIGVFCLFIMTLLFIFIGSPGALKVSIPIEVSLGARTSWSIAFQSVLFSAKQFLFGSGPGTFVYNFSQYRPQEFNLNELVWSVRFRQSYNSFFSLLSEVGVLGVLTWLFMVIFSFGSILSAWFNTRPSIWKRTVQRVAKDMTHEANPQVRLRLEIFVLVASWVALTFGFFVLYYDMMGWWLWWTLLALVLTGISAILPDVMFDKKIYLQVSPQYSLAVSFGMVCVFVAVVLFGTSQGRIFFAEAAFTQASRSSSVDGSEQFIQKSLIYRPGYVPYRLALARIHLQQARILSEQGDANPEQVASLVANAVNDARFAADADTKNVETWETLAAMYMNARVFAKEANVWAQDALHNVVDLEPTNAIAHWRLGDTYLFAQEYDQAETWYKQAIALKPNHLQMYNSLSDLYESQDDLDKAIAVYEPIAHLISQNSEMSFAIGRLFYNRGMGDDVEQAQLLWEQAVALSPNFSNALFSLGLLHEKNENMEKALDYYKQVQVLNPDNEDIQKKIRLLTQ